MFRPTEDNQQNQSAQEVRTKLIGEMTEEEYLQVFVKGHLMALRTQEEMQRQKDPDGFKLPEIKNDNVFTATLGTVGGVAHGLVDVVEGLVRGVVDVTTLGTARRR